MLNVISCSWKWRWDDFSCFFLFPPIPSPHRYLLITNRKWAYIYLEKVEFGLINCQSIMTRKSQTTFAWKLVVFMVKVFLFFPLPNMLDSGLFKEAPICYLNVTETISLKNWKILMLASMTKGNYIFTFMY